MGVHYAIKLQTTPAVLNVAFMRCIMDAYPFCVFKRADRPCFLVKFKDEAGNYLPPISTKKNTRDEAMQVAFKWLRDGIPQKEAALKVSDLSLKDMVRKIKAEDEAETLLTELRRQGWVKSYVQSETPGAVDFISFLFIGNRFSRGGF